MGIQAEVVSSITSAPVQMTLSGSTITVDTNNASRVALQISANDVQDYLRQGDDLILLLRNGGKAILDGFFRNDGDGHPILALVGRSDAFVAVTFSGEAQGLLEPTVSNGLFPGNGSGSGGGGGTPVPMPLMVGGALAGGVAAVAAAGRGSSGGGGGNNLPADPGVPPVEVDPVTDPGEDAGAGEVHVRSAHGNTLAGVATAGSTIGVDVDGNGSLEATATADENGEWSMKVEAGLPEGAEITLVTIGEDSTFTSSVKWVVDKTAPVHAGVETTEGSSRVPSTEDAEIDEADMVHETPDAEDATLYLSDGGILLDDLLDQGRPTETSATDVLGNGEKLVTDVAELMETRGGEDDLGILADSRAAADSSPQRPQAAGETAFDMLVSGATMIALDQPAELFI